jgi:hypothetical protein
MILSDEQAKAAQEVAKATGKALDVASGAGTVLINGTVGKIAAATLGIVGGDWVQEQQKRNLARLEAKTARILDGVDKDRLSAPSPSVVKPLLEAAADESREELQDLWAALLANAMLDGGKRTRRDYFDVLRQMEPTDALLFDIVCRQPSLRPNHNATLQFIADETKRLGITENDKWISVLKLRSLDCLGSNWPGELTPRGIGLARACSLT